MQRMILARFVQLIECDPLLQGGQPHVLGDAVTVANGKCLFTVEALFNALSDELAVDYRAFRSGLYNSSLNQQLGQRGYRIEISRSTGKIDSSVYQLVRC